MATKGISKNMLCRIAAIITMATILHHTSVRAQHPNVDPTLIKIIGDKVVEEHEVMELVLSDYFQGQLLKYEISLDNPDPTKDFNPAEISDLIDLREPFQEFSSQLITDDSYRHIKRQPFRDTTLIIDEQTAAVRNSTTLTLNFVNRDLKFMIYNLTRYADSGQMQKIYELQLNTSLINADCQNLMYDKRTSPYQERYILFCKQYRLEYGYISGYISVIMINKTAIFKTPDDPYIVREYTFAEEDLVYELDFGKGLKLLRTQNFTISDEDTKYIKYVIGFASATSRRYRVYGVNLTVFETMAKQNLTWMEGSGEVMTNVQTFKFTGLGLVYDLQDILVIREDDQTRDNLEYIAFAMKGLGVRICAYDRNLIGSYKQKELECFYDQSQLLKNEGYQIISLFKMPYGASDYENVEDYFYAVSSRPPAVLEYDMSDIDNIIVNKIFTIVDSSDPFIGQAQIAVNKNFIMHLLISPDTGQQAIRVYCRHSFLYSHAKFQIDINPLTVADFFGFPNVFFNIVIFRDERTVNVTAIVDAALVLDATNSTLVGKYKNLPFEIILFSQNNKFLIPQRFNVTFLDQFNTSIQIFGSRDSNQTDINVFYNCGEKQFEYIVSDFVNGPNYNLTVIGDLNTSNFFKFENQELRLFQTARFNFSKCRVNYLALFESDGDYSGQQSPSILVCIDTEQSTVASYLIRQANHSVIMKTNQITLPELRFIDFAYDIEHRIIIALAEQPAFQGEGKEWFVHNRYEVHVFKIQNQVLWKNMFEYRQLRNVTVFSYNHQVNLCVFVEFKSLGESRKSIGDIEIIRVNPFNFSSSNLGKQITGTFLNVTYDRRIVKASLSSQHVIFTLSANKIMGVYQITKKIQKIREMAIEGIVNFDIFENQYFVVYRGKNIVDIYSIDMLIYPSFRKRLTLYKDYENFEFQTTYGYGHALPNIVRTNRRNILTFMLKESTNSSHVHVFVYCLESNQHNSFVMTMDVSTQFGRPKEDYFHVILTGDDNGRNTLGMMSGGLIQLYDGQYSNKLTLCKEKTEELIDKCREVRLKYNNDTGVDEDYFMLVDTIQVKPQTLFNGLNGGDHEHILNLQVTTQNQGLAVRAKSEIDKQINIVIFNESTNSIEPFRLLHETYMEGQALRFQTECSYHDWEGKLQDCSSAYNEENKDVPYYFPIEFVTNSRRVVKSFTLGKLFFIFDSTYQVNVHRLPLYQQNLESVDGQALIKLYQGSEKEMFGCEITGFTDIFRIDNYEKYFLIDDLTSQSYFVFYHCKECEYTHRKVLRIAIITVFPIPETVSEYHSQEQDMPFEVTLFNESIDIPYQILDLEIFDINYRIVSEDLKQIQFKIGFSCLVENSFSNLLKVFRVLLNPVKETCLFSAIDTLSAISLTRNSYFVTKLITIPKTNLIIAVIQDFGIQILNLTRLDVSDSHDEPRISEIVLKELDILENQQFKSQITKESGELQVHNVALNLPNAIHVFTNYGIYIFEFAIDLTSYESIRLAGAFTPRSVRVVLMDYDSFGGEVAQNPYGSTFLVKKRVGGDNYDVQLVAVSYYSAPNSRLFKSIYVTSNEECISLNQDSYFEFSPEDQLAVSFICNQYLQIYRVCMRPHVALDFSKLQQLATDKDSNSGRYKPGVYQYNEFNVTITAFSNKFDREDNQESIEVMVHYQQKSKDRNYVYIAIGLIVGCLILFAIFYVDQTVCTPNKELKELNKSVEYLPTPSQNNRQHNINGSIAMSSFISLPLTNKSGNSPLTTLGSTVSDASSVLLQREITPPEHKSSSKKPSLLNIFEVAKSKLSVKMSRQMPQIDEEDSKDRQFFKSVIEDTSEQTFDDWNASQRPE